MSSSSQPMVSDPHVSSSKKLWIPLENNPDVMTPLAHKLGLSEELIFVDVLSLTEKELLDWVPRPVYALLFLYPTSAQIEKEHQEEEDKLEEYSGSGSKEPVLWFHQTIGNACGLIGLLHCVTNGPATKHIKSGSVLDKLTRAALHLNPRDRADLLYNSEELESAHKEAAGTGDSHVPDLTTEHVGYAYTAFVRGIDGKQWELEGRRKGPVSRGELKPNADLLSADAMEHNVNRYLNGAQEGYSCLALVRDPDYKG